MAIEIEWQRRIIKQIVKEGGYGKKWSTQYAVGVPDLILSLPTLGAVFSEVKLEKHWHKNTHRTIALTDKQNYELNKLRDAGAKVCVLLVVENGQDDMRVNVLPVPQHRAELRISKEDALEGAFKWRHRGQREGFIEWMKGELRCLM